MEFKTKFLIKLDRAFVLFIYSQRKRLTGVEQLRAKLFQASRAISFASLVRVNIDAFEKGDWRRLAEDVGFEEKPVIFHPNPRPSFFDSAKCCIAKAARIALQRAEATLLK